VLTVSISISLRYVISGGQDCNVIKWDLYSPKRMQHVIKDEGFINAACISSSEDRILYGGSSQYVKICRV